MRGLTSRQRISAIILAVVALSFTTLDVAGGGLRDAHSGARGLLGSLYRGTDALAGPARRFIQGVPEVASARSKIDALERQNAQLRRQLAANSTDATTRARLDRLQLAADSGGYPIMAARVVAYGPGAGFEWTITIDAGTSSGIAVEQTVTDGDALVGRVLHVSTSSSVVLLAADPGSGVGVRDVRNGQLGVASGSGLRGFSLSPLDPGAELKVGDLLETGPTGQTTYAAGLTVGTISSVRVSADGTTAATVKPATSPSGLDVVGVILAASPVTPPRAPITPAVRR